PATIAGGSKAETTITPPALVSPPLSRPAPTRRALPANPAAQRGQNWTPMRGQICKPIDIENLLRSVWHAVFTLFCDEGETAARRQRSDVRWNRAAAQCF